MDEALGCLRERPNAVETPHVPAPIMRTDFGVDWGCGSGEVDEEGEGGYSCVIVALPLVLDKLERWRI